ncbi:F0F1 ATP synthase subunit A [Flavobacterium sp.]|uniref:F0F1 ATP synthase subunit A n=1 Tax=Flavobacterium sp. TaxID=239 RepID=UPI00262F11B7|nr:F0F1 ATP synthase subunit A [Flavobacterium sp.]
MVISKKPLHFIVALLVAFMPLISIANPTNDSTKVEAHAVEATHEKTDAHAEPTHEGEAHAEAKKTPEEERAEFMQHHLLDSHDFHLFSYGKESGEEKHVSFPLPVILWDNGLQFFMSSKFHHGESVVESNGNYYKLFHEKIYKTDVAGNLEMDEHHHPTNIKPLDLSITKNIFMVIVTAILMFWLFVSLAKSYKKNNGIATGVGRFFEPIILFIRDDIAIPNIGEKHYKKYMSHLLTVFFFIWFLNMFGLTPLGVNVTNNIAITAALAILTYIITTFTANKNYWGHIFWMPGVPVPMKIILAPIELLGTLIKPFSLTVRLYANMLAGHVVLMSIIGMMYTFNNMVGSSLSFVLAFALSILEILVAGLQAYIFTMLTALYFGAAKEEHHHDDAH